MSKCNHSVKIFCPCQESNITSHQTSSNPTSPLHIPTTLYKPYTLHDLEYLYFCDHCKTIKCPNCINEEIISRYCPNCLIEVTESSAKSSSNKCLRNCIQCPGCNSSITTNLDSNNNYILTCNYCEWKTSPSDLPIKKSSISIAQQVVNIKEMNEYKRFKEITKVLQKDIRQTINLPFKIHNKQSFEPFKKDMSIVINEAKEDTPTTPTTPTTPNLIHLRSKTAKRCKTCRHSLIKPDPRPNSIKFKTKFLAMNYLPNLYLQEVKTTEDNVATPTITSTRNLLLTLTNSLPTQMKINMSTSQSSVTLITPQVELGANPELWDEESLIKGVPFSRIAKETKVTKRVFMNKERIKQTTSIHDSGPNWVTIPIEISLSSSQSTSTPTFNLPLFLSISYQEEDEDEQQQQLKLPSENIRIGIWYIIEIKA